MNRARRLAGPLLLFWLAATGLQWVAGAFSADFGQEPDEAAHYITALMISDYARSGGALAPIEYAERYYVHYPRVAFGLWPPLFHLTLAGWMLPFGPSRASVLALEALLAAVFALLLFREAQRRWGDAAGIVLGVLLLSLNAVRVSTSSVMADLELACFCSAAVLLFGRYLESERVRYAALFGIASAAAILTKYNGLALAGVPLLAVALAGRWDLLRRASFWLPAGIVLAICGPWYFAHRQLIRYAAEPIPGTNEIGRAMAGNALELLRIAGPVPFIAAVFGVAILLRGKRLGERDAAGISLVIALWMFHSIAYPIVGARYVLASAPVLLLLAAASLHELVGWLGRSHPVLSRRAPVAACFLAGACIAADFRLYAKPVHGFSPAADRILNGKFEAPVYIVAADSTGEGALIAEVAMREPRPKSIVLRSSKVLASSTEMGEEYRTLYRTPEELLQFLEGAGVVALVLRPMNSLDHHRQLLDLLTRYPERWRPLGRFGSGNQQPVEAFAFIPRPGASPSKRLKIDMQYTLGRSIQ